MTYTFGNLRMKYKWLIFKIVCVNSNYEASIKGVISLLNLL